MNVNTKRCARLVEHHAIDSLSLSFRRLVQIKQIVKVQ